MDDLERKLNELGDDFWTGLKAHSRKIASSSLCREWWHNKLYESGNLIDGNVEQTVLGLGVREVPYTRELFHPSPSGRFSLGERPVAYFSQDFGANCCEVIEQFRNQADLSWDELRQYLQGESSVDGDWFGYPLSVRIRPEALIADFCSPGNPLFIALREDEESIRRFYSDTVMSREPDAKRGTQAIARAVEKAGFHGIVFRSVRAPRDIVLPDRNLVLFSKEMVVRDPWDPENPEGFLAK